MGRFHTLVVIALGITWILDGLEVTLAGAVAGALRQSPVLQFTSADIGLAAAPTRRRRRWRRVLRLADGPPEDARSSSSSRSASIGRDRATAFTWNIWSFMLCRSSWRGHWRRVRCYNSTIQEWCRHACAADGSRDQRQLLVGAAIGAAGSIVLLDPICCRLTSAGARHF